MWLRYLWSRCITCSELILAWTIYRSDSIQVVSLRYFLTTPIISLIAEKSC